MTFADCLKNAVPRLALAAVLMAAVRVRADSDDGTFVSGLRQRHVFSLAETYCRQRLKSQQLTEIERAELTIELMLSYSTHAVNSAPAQRQLLWDKAHEVADQFIANQSKSPRQILVRVQKALTDLADGQLRRQEWEAGATSRDGPETALKSLRQAAGLLTELDKELDAEIPIRRRRSVAADELSADQLFALQNNIRCHLARTYRNLALCYPADSVDRIDALTRLLEQHRELERRLPADDPLRLPIRLESIVCERNLSHFESARRRLTALLASPIPTEFQLDGRAEAIRLELAQQRLQVALSILGQGRTLDGQSSPELDLAHVETYLALAEDTAEEQAKTVEWQKKAMAMVRLIEQTHGPYWARRANLRLIRSASQNAAPHDVEILVRVADDAYVRGQFQEAVESYDRAARVAQTTHMLDEAFALFYKAALVEHAQRNRAGASRRLRDLAQSMPTYPKSPEAHLLAVWNAAQLAESDPDSLSHYSELLEEHIRSWPEARTADQARMWLGRLRERELAWTEAIGIYWEVSPAAPQFSDAVAAAARCSQQYFGERKANGEPFQEQARLAAARFEDLVYRNGRELPQPCSAPQRTAATAAARIRLQFGSDDHAAAGSVLEAALNASLDAPQPWLAEARALLVVALAGQPGRRQKAADMLQTVADASPAHLLEMLTGLADMVPTAQPTGQIEIAQLQLAAVARLSPKAAELDAANQLRLRQIEAAALAVSGQDDRARTMYEHLARQHPLNAPIQKGYAQLLLDSDDKAILEQALVQWRKVDRASRPGTEQWYRAKYSIALAQYKLGQRERAAQLIQYLQATPPGLAATPLKPQFERLLARCLPP